ncbi:Heme-binding protein A [bacterium HR23]|nr:Heme-binding protein A [bacterium HR23]
MQRPRRSLILFGGVCLGVLLVLAVGCRPAAQPTPTPTPAPAPTPVVRATPTPTPIPPTPTPPPVITPTGTLTVAVATVNVPSGTPRFCTAGCAENVYQVSAFETLFRPASGDFAGEKPEVPILAESWTMDTSMPPKWLDFKLRQGIPFHKGYGEMTAEDVAFSFNDANSRTTPESIHGQAGDFYPLIKKMEPLDKYTVRLWYETFDSRGLRHRFSLFWQTAGVTSKKVFDELGPEKMRTVFIGTGPFMITEYTQNKGIFLEAVDKHWRQTARFKTVRILEVPEAATRRAMALTGEADIVEPALKDVPDLLKAGLKGVDTGNYQQEIIFFTGNYWEKKHVITGQPLERKLDLTKPWVSPNPDDDPARAERARKVRWALALDIDREGLNKAILQGLGRPTHIGYVSIAHKEFQEKWKVPYDPARAKQLLQEAGGWPAGVNMEMHCWTPAVWGELCEAIASVWLTDLGIKTDIEKVAYTVYRPGLVQRTTSKPIIFPGDDGKSGFPYRWAKGFTNCSISAGGFGVGMEIPKMCELYLKTAAEIDPIKQKQYVDEFHDYSYHWMLMPGTIEYPQIMIYNPKRIASWDLLPNTNANLGGLSNLESVVPVR